MTFTVGLVFETVTNHKRGIPCHLPSPPQNLSLSSFCGVCVLGGDASACSLFQKEHGRLRTLLCGLGKRKVQFRQLSLYCVSHTNWKGKMEENRKAGIVF